MKNFYLGLGVCALLLSLAAQAQVYSWTDKDGRKHYADIPPPKVDVQSRNLVDNRIEQDKLGYEAKQAASRFPLTLYVSEDCKDPCTQARQWLQKRKAPFGERMLKTEAEVAAFKTLTGKKEVYLPSLMVGDKHMEGFEAGSWGTALDSAGYPK